MLLNTKAQDILLDDNGQWRASSAPAKPATPCHQGQERRGRHRRLCQLVELRQAYNIQWADLGRKSSPPTTGATGDAIKMLMKLRADFIQMGNIQLLRWRSGDGQPFRQH